MKTRIKFQEESIARNFMETNAKMRKKTLKHKIKFGVQKEFVTDFLLIKHFIFGPKLLKKCVNLRGAFIIDSIFVVESSAISQHTLKIRFKQMRIVI